MIVALRFLSFIQNGLSVNEKIALGGFAILLLSNLIAVLWFFFGLKANQKYLIGVARGHADEISLLHRIVAGVEKSLETLSAQQETTREEISLLRQIAQRQERRLSTVEGLLMALSKLDPPPPDGGPVE